MKNDNFGEVKIKDNFLPPTLFDQIKFCAFSPEINWNYNLIATTNSPTENSKDSIDDYFVHKLLWTQNGQIFTSPQYGIINPILFFIDDRFKYKIDRILRINLTMIARKQKNIVTPYHVDNSELHHVGIFYLTSCNGPTMVQNMQIDCVENRFVLFDGRYVHAAVQQTDINSRINIVFNFLGTFY